MEHFFMPHSNKDKIVISVGGSLIYPQSGLDTEFLTNLNNFVRSQLTVNPNRQFFLVSGGGVIARQYRDAGKTVVGHELTHDDMDWLGIHATRLNAHLVRTIFRDIAHPFIIKKYDIIRKIEEPVAVAAGWKPGWSTDYDAVILCEDYAIRKVINMSNIHQVFDKDPKQYPDAVPLNHVTWSEFRQMVGDEWTPGMNAPFDPIASQRAEELKVKVVVVGPDFANLEKYLHGEEFVGTVIE
jgi:uridylate kinase